MNTSMRQSSVSLAESNQGNQLDLNREQNKMTLLAVLTVMMFGFLLFAPQYLPSKIVGILLGVVPAIYMTWYLQSYPHALRNRSGSSATAIGLVVFLWIVAIASSATILAGIVK